MTNHVRRFPIALAACFCLSLSLAWGERTEGEYAVVLDEPPLAAGMTSRTQMRSAASGDRRAKIAAAQSAISRAMASRQIRVTGTADLLVNAIFVNATREQAQEIARMEGVRYVQFLPRVRRSMNRAIDLVRAQQGWAAVGGEQSAGAGVKIGIFDTGIDHTHPAFQDSALSPPSGFPKGRAEDLPYTTNKIIVARSYVAQLPFAEVRAEDSRPDDRTPRDRDGHGTAMAMVAAGRRVQGPAAVTVGIAPKAFLGNYKIFGSPGVNDSTRTSVLIQALQDSISDGMDIIVLPLASPAEFSPLLRDPDCAGSAPIGFDVPQDACDVRAYAVENAVRLGLTVVVGAGNDGLEFDFPALASISTPGTAPSVITVGASTNSHVFFSTVRGEGNAPPELVEVDALFGNGPRPAAPLRAPLRDVRTVQNNGLGCDPMGNNTLAGAIALIERGECAFAAKVNNAQRAGAVGVLIYQPDGVNGLFYMQNLVETGIPAALIRNRDAVRFINWANNNPNATVVLDPALREEDAEFNTVADFTSHGPSIGDVTRGEAPIKPELVAVGTDLYVATQKLDPNGELYDPSGFTSAQGTSLSAAVVAGAAALVKQRNPGFTPAQIKSALVNTATTDVRDSRGQARVVAIGAGKLNVEAAVAATVTVDPPTLSFGVLNAAGSLPRTLSLRIRNGGSSPQSLQFSVERRDSDSAAQFTITPPQADVPAGGETTISVRLAGNRPGPGQFEGIVRVRGSGVDLRVPYLYMVGDGIPFDMFALYGQDFLGVVNERGWLMEAKVVDRYGVPVPNVQTDFFHIRGGGRIESQLRATDVAGITFANVQLGPTLGEQAFGVAAGNLELGFFGRVRLQPVIDSDGVVNAASGLSGPLAPGSYISIFGRGLAETTRVAGTASLPLSLSGVSVSFDAPGISVPGRLHFISERQVNVQIPWEFEGQTSVQMKVSIGPANTESTAVINVPLAQQSPAFFEFDDAAGGRRLIAALNQDFQVLTVANPARKGAAVQLYVNGLGPVDERPASGEPTRTDRLVNTRSAPAVTIGGVPAQVLFSGMAPGNVGLYQVNAIVPNDAPSGAQPVVLTINGSTAKTATLPIQ